MMSVLPIAATINHLLSRQATLTSLLKTHAGKTACFDVGIVQLYLCVTGEGLLRQVEQIQVADNKPSVTIRINPTELPAILADMKQAFSHVTIEGDADFAKTISEVAMHLQWDAEEDLAPFIGDIAAVRLVQFAKSSLHNVKASSQSFVDSVAEYLLEEQPVLLRRQKRIEFSAQVMTVRDDTERLAKRIALLEKQYQEQA
jgi:ubiquinone biosynthesis protein UbiJ